VRSQTGEDQRKNVAELIPLFVGERWVPPSPGIKVERRREQRDGGEKARKDRRPFLISSGYWMNTKMSETETIAKKGKPGKKNEPKVIARSQKLDQP